MAGVTGLGEDLADGAVVMSMCDSSHTCGKKFTTECFCEQKVPTVHMDRFEYIYHEINGCKKRCAYVKPSGKVNH